MSLFNNADAVERPVFFDGQQLYADDLQGLADFHQAMREEHLRTLHDKGVGQGYAVFGHRADKEVRIDPGYAIDCFGHEILLLESITEPVPPVAADTDGGPVAYDITVAYPSPEDLDEAETREGVCLPGGAVRLRERPVICWVRLAKDVLGRLQAVDPQQRDDIKLARKIVITRAYVRNCQLDADLVIAPRRKARPEPCPHIACGRVSPVDWERWDIVPLAGNASSRIVGLKTVVDTSSGAFTTTPTYQVRVEGVRPLLVELDPPFEGPIPTALVLDVPAFVSDPETKQFGCWLPVVRLDGMLEDADADHLVEAAKEFWDVVWMGVEP
jgi:hypothetical protein